MILRIEEADALSFELRHVPVTLTDLHVLSLLNKIFFVAVSIVYQHRLLENDVTDFLDALLHACEGVLHGHALQVAKTPDANNTVIVVIWPFEVFNVLLVLRHAIGHALHHLLRAVQHLDVPEHLRQD